MTCKMVLTFLVVIDVQACDRCRSSGAEISNMRQV